MERGEEGEVCRRGRRVRVVQYVSRHEPARRMSDESSSFYQLDERIQRFLWIEGWESLRDAQELAIPLILGGERDVIVSAATASGKTEAAFLPALTHLRSEEHTSELQSLMRISYAVFCLKKKHNKTIQ